MISKLHAYQQNALEWILKRNSSGLFLPPGLGKTLITLSAIDLLIKHKAIDRVLIIAPLRVAHLVWPKEIKKWGFDLSIGILHGKDKDTIVRQKHDIYVVNPEGLKWLFGHHSRLFDKFNFMLVCDESTLFKNQGSQRFSLLRKQLSKFTKRLILTGTPAPNGLLQLWPQIFILDFGNRLGKNISTYRRQWFAKDFSGFGYNLIPGSEDQIYGAINDLVMHKSNDELDLPELMTNTINVSLSSHARTAYKTMKDTFIAELGNEIETEISAVNAASKTAKLKQIANGVVYGEDREVVIIHDEKLNATKELIESLAGSPLMIVYEYLHDLKRLTTELNCPYIGGGISGDELTTIVDMWNKGSIPVLLVQPQAASHGLNLQDGGCHDVLHYSITYDLELYEQVNKRVHRQGVKNNVTIHHLVAEGTCDENIMRILEGKSKLQDELLKSLLK